MKKFRTCLIESLLNIAFIGNHSLKHWRSRTDRSHCQRSWPINVKIFTRTPMTLIKSFSWLKKWISNTQSWSKQPKNLNTPSKTSTKECLMLKTKSQNWNRTTTISSPSSKTTLISMKARISKLPSNSTSLIKNGILLNEIHMCLLKLRSCSTKDLIQLHFHFGH